MSKKVINTKKSDVIKKCEMKKHIFSDSQALFQQIMEQSPIAIQIHSPDGWLIQHNAAFEKLYDIPREALAELYEKYNLLRDVQGIKLGLMPYIEKVFSGEECLFPIFEYDGVEASKTLGLKHPAKRKRWVKTRGFPVKNKNGELICVVLMLEDMTEQKKAIEDLFSSREKFQKFFQSTPVSMTIINLAINKFVEVNRAFEKKFGYSSEDIAGKHPLEIDLWKNKADRERLMLLLIKQGYLYVPRLELLKKSGETVIAEGYFTRMQIGDEDLSFSEFIDITERVQAEEELSRLRSELLHATRTSTMVELTAALAHEINHPLGSILNNANAAKRMLDGNDPDLNEIRDIITDIIAEDLRAYDVIQKLKSLMKKSEIELQPIQINDTINDVIKFLRSELVIKDISLSTNMDEKLAKVNCDRTHLQQIFLNLILNSFEAMKNRKNRNLYISTAYKDAGNIIITIKDSGTGIDESNKDLIFKPFFTTKKEGMGMGLAISKTIIDTHCGNIWAENNEEEGATFFITLPIYKESPA